MKKTATAYAHIRMKPHSSTIDALKLLFFAFDLLLLSRSTTRTMFQNSLSHIHGQAVLALQSSCSWLAQ